MSKLLTTFLSGQTVKINLFFKKKTCQRILYRTSVNTQVTSHQKMIYKR